jgi:hypothetical protein
LEFRPYAITGDTFLEVVDFSSSARTTAPEIIQMSVNHIPNIRRNSLLAHSTPVGLPRYNNNPKSMAGV